MKTTLAVLAVLAALPLAALAQKPKTQTAMAEMTATIEAIDHTSRLITLKDKDGDTETIYAGPEVKRFDDLKVGETVTFRYYESVAYQIRKPGQAASAPASEEAKITRGTGAKPAATVSKQSTATVTIKAIDAKVPSVSVLTEDGRSLSLKVDDKKNLEGLKAGDKVEITYTQAFMVAVK
jgi:pyridoxine/pyridoxamine 5'-phosphate oxidase